MLVLISTTVCDCPERKLFSSKGFSLIMAYDAYYYWDIDGLEQVVYQPRIEPEPRYPIPFRVQVEVTITLQLKLVHHYCLTDQFIEADDPFVFQQNRRFDLHVLKNNYRAYMTLACMLGNLRINPDNPVYNACIDDIIQHGLRSAKWPSNKGRKVLPIYAVLTGRIVEHIDEEEEGVLIGRALAESESDFETSNYGMVPASESSFKEMLKRVRVEDGESEKDGERIKRRRVKGEDCVICLEELKVGSYASRMPCLHTFHDDCIESWLKQSHYCPLCRFEMPTRDLELSFSASS